MNTDSEGIGVQKMEHHPEFWFWQWHLVYEMSIRCHWRGIRSQSSQLKSIEKATCINTILFVCLIYQRWCCNIEVLVECSLCSGLWTKNEILYHNFYICTEVFNLICRYLKKIIWRIFFFPKLYLNFWFGDKNHCVCNMNSFLKFVKEHTVSIQRLNWF